MISRLFINYRNLALAALIFSIGMLFVALSSATEAAPPTPKKDDSKLQFEPAEAELVNKNTAESGLYIVQLDDAPLATYRGGITGLRATMPSIRGEAKLDVNSPDSVAYLQYLRGKHNEFVSLVESTLARSINVKYRYDVAYNGMAIELSAAEASEVAKLPGVVKIAPDSLRELHTDAGPEWIGAPAIWGGNLEEIGFEANLSGDNEVPPVTDTMASGLATFSFDVETRELDYMIEVSDIMSITKAHIHTGTVGTNGSALHWLYDVTGTNAQGGEFPISGTVTLNDSELAALWTSGLYINVHTEDYPAGEIRGQIEMVGTMGENIVVGVIDTGINMDHPSFAEIGEDGYEHTNPRGEFYGDCAEGGSLEGLCNDKLIGAYAYNGAPSPEDTNGHGSHTASTAAGNVIRSAVISAPTTSVTVTQISGVAPHANIIAYNACNPCLLSGLVAAINQATIDQVDVINYSIGGGTSDPWSDQDALAFLGARAAGVFVASSAGNSGSAAATVGSPGDAPWLLTVGSSSHNRAFTNMLQNLSGGDTTPPADIAGEGVTGSLGPTPIVYAGAIDPNNPGCDVTYPAGTFDGEIVVCDYNQGPGAIPGQYNGRVNKSRNLAQAGAGGFILINRVDWAAALMVDSYALPGMGIPYDDGEALKTWLDSGSDHEGSIRGVESESDRGDIMAGFSSRGPNVPAPDIIKPDVTAPGRRIVAAIATTDPNAPPEFDVYQGTSMSSPHAAGAAALMRAVHSNWTPSEVQSALMGTALNNGVLKEDATTEADPFDMGAGRIDLTQAMNAALVLDVTAPEFEDANPADGGDPKTLNLASLGNSQCVGSCSWTRTVQSTLEMTQTWDAAVVVADGVTFTGSVEPASFVLAPGATQELTIEVDVSDLPEGEWFFGELMLTPSTLVRSGIGGSEVPESHMPIAVQSSAGVLPDAIEIDTRRNAGSQLVEGIEAIEITDLTVNSMGLAQGQLTSTIISEDSSNTSPYDDLTDGVFYISVDVPADTYSLIAETIESSADDMELFVGLDTDEDGMPEAAEQLCSSTSSTAIEFCDIVAPAEGSYWILVQNWAASASPPDSVTLVTAVVPNSDNDNMTVDGPESQPSGEPFDIRLFWDTPEMMAGDRWYGYVSLGSDGTNAGNIGTIPVYVNRHPDDVTKDVSASLVEGGEMVTYTITVHPNVTAEDLTYSLTDTIPAGMTYVADSASATEGTVDVTDGVLTWNGTLPAANTFTYAVSTSNDDATCVAPLANSGAYVNLAGYGLATNPDIAGDNVLFTSNFSGGEHSFFGEYQGENVNYTDDGFAFFDPATPGAMPGTNEPIPTAGDPDNLMAIFWRDMTIVYDAATNRGITTANLTSGGVPNAALIEYDDVEDANGDTYDFEVIMRYEPSDSWYEYIFAYDNLTGDVELGTIGLENAAGNLGVQYAYDDIAVTNQMAVCFDQVPLVSDPVVITYQATADEDAAGEVTNMVYHNTDNPGSLEAMASATTEVENDGIDGGTEDEAPNGGDGNGDGMADSEQGNVTSLPNAGDEDGYVTLEAPEGLSLVNVSVMTTPMTLPTGVEAMPQGLFDFTVEGLNNGDSVTVTLYLHASDSELDGYWKYDEATATWIDVSSIATFGTAVISDTTVTTVMLHLTDGGMGDMDGEANGTIVDPGAPSRAAPTSISLANFGQEASLVWQPIALLALLLLLMAGGAVALLQRRRIV